MTRRFIDIVVAIAALVALWPFLLVIAAIVWIDSPGNPFYGGWRAGLGNKQFRMWKFRTMVKGAGVRGPVITARNDPRITAVGRVLRKTKIDELPQFVNLLMGDLTLVGPRAEVPDIVSHYTANQATLLQVKPGITGPGQIYYTTDQANTIPDNIAADAYYLDHLLDEKLQIDMDYLKHRTPLSDVRIVFGTAKLVLQSFLRG